MLKSLGCLKSPSFVSQQFTVQAKKISPPDWWAAYIIAILLYKQIEDKPRGLSSLLDLG